MRLDSLCLAEVLVELKVRGIVNVTQARLRLRCDRAECRDRPWMEACGSSSPGSTSTPWNRLCEFRVRPAVGRWWAWQSSDTVLQFQPSRPSNA